jgi:hypothetical protein
MAIMRRRPDQVETNAIAPPVRRAFEAGLEKAGEGRFPTH